MQSNTAILKKVALFTAILLFTIPVVGLISDISITAGRIFIFSYGGILLLGSIIRLISERYSSKLVLKALSDKITSITALIVLVSSMIGIFILMWKIIKFMFFYTKV